MPSSTTVPLLALAVLVCTGLGCTSTGPRVSIRPDGTPGPEKCSDEALKTMRILRIQPGTSAFVEIDANQTNQSPVTLTDGPVEGFLDEALETLPVTTRVYGYIWTSGPNVHIRYYEARPPNGDRIPICGVVRWGPEGSKKLPGSRPGVAVLQLSYAAMWFVDDFR